MKHFWDALEKSYLITGSSMIMFGGTACYMWATGKTPPNELLHLVGVLLGAFVGGSAVKSALALKAK